MKTLWKTLKLVELFQTRDFEIVFEYKHEEISVQPNARRLINYESRQKWSNTQSYKWRIDKKFNSLDEAREFVDEFLENNFILYPFDENGN